MLLSILVAISENGVIGRDGGLPWRLSGDLKRFKQLTMGHTIIMGRRTWESIGRPLPGRRTVVVSRQVDYLTGVDGVPVAHSLDEAIRMAEQLGDVEAFVVGGAELYREALGRADRVYLTRVLAEIAGDTSFPTVDWNGWQQLESTAQPADDKNVYPSEFQVYERSEPTCQN
ncbi:MAG: dihydrofolate reductase [Pirellulales bacterium]